MESARTSTMSEIVAAGAVLWRPASDGVEVAVVHRPRYDDWSLPKGKLARGESVPAAAVREVAEETGSTAVLGVQLGDSHYRVPQGDKVVHYWSARASGGEFAPNDEVDELRWLRPELAGGLLSYSRDGEILDRFRQLEPPPRPLLLVRHAKAGSRYDWDGDDYQRPLTVKGREQAGKLSELLRLFGPTRAYAATPIRCPQTIQPLADRLHLPITPEPLLGEEDYWKDPDAAFSRFLALSAGSEVAVVCSQGGVIPDLITRLTGKEEPPARKASTWVLGFTGDRVVTADYYSEPTG
ncbi:MAG TPA: NUDIX hydrolase [Pseudonocardia sp.]|uniref:NUDIX hydrolase n=1 Tax=Pseudonocardia sp. TaxID=60912 RepID=UPI002C8E4293|nr:NUDIX hydrolase [Pseudonocardia sp.]HTF51704.1 NUDIX hydrolase [Pseudonocardia sp.]